MWDIFGLFNKWGVILLYLLKYCFPGDFSWNLSYSRSTYSYLHYFSIKTIDNINVLYLFLLPGCISFDLEIYRYLLSRSDIHRYRYANRSTGIIGYITRMLFHLCLIVKCQVRWSRNLSFDICNVTDIHILSRYTYVSTILYHRLLCYVMNECHTDLCPILLM